MTKRRVVITGLGALCPIGLSVTESWDAALAGKSGVGPITRFDASTFSAKIAAEVKGFDPLKILDPKEVKRLDLFSQYALSAADEAWNDAKLAGHTINPARMGCILGVGLGGLPILEKYHQIYLEEGVRKISPFLIPMMISNLAPGNVAIRFGLKGPNYTVTSACTSSTHAIGEAFKLIREGSQDVVLTGGSESTVTPIAVGGFAAMKALSTRNEEPQKASRPFDKDRDGFVLGEGSAVLVLEELSSALSRGAKIYGELCGYGASCDAFHITAPPTDGEGARSCMTLAMADAGIKPEQIGYINAHGTSTPANDVAETAAIKAVFGEHAKSKLLVSSTKSMTGHLLGAAGAIEAVFCAKALEQGIIPPTANLDNPDEGCDLDYVAKTPRKTQVDYVMSNSFGFGGTNAAIVMKRFTK